MVRPVWIEVDLAVLRRNFALVRNSLGRKIKIIATIKQFAYGHGLLPVARELVHLGVDFLGVGSIEEAITLREAKFTAPIIVLTSVFSKFSDYFIRYKIRPTVVDEGFAKELNKEAEKRNVIFPIHIKIDTGMGRIGFYYKDAHRFVKRLSKLKNLSFEGIYTHFPVADIDPEFTNHQIGVFNEFILKLKEEGILFKFHHCANSIGIANYPQSHFNMVRPGFILYGGKSHPRMNLSGEPILTLKSRVIFLKKVSKGMGVSYGRSYIAKDSTTIATVAIGYADGYPWALSNKGKVIIKDNLFDLAGRVCMDHIMVDVGRGSDIKLADEVILIGKRGKLKLTIEDLAAWANTIPYEIISRLSLKIPRVYKFPSIGDTLHNPLRAKGVKTKL